MKTIIFTVINDLNYDQRMMRICTSLTKHGYNCILVGRKHNASIPLESKLYQQKRLNCFFEKGKLFYLEYNVRLFFCLFLKKFDAICSIDADTVLPGLFVAKLKSKIHIFDAHELFTQVPEVVNRPAVQKIWEWVQKQAFTNTDFAYTVGFELADYFEKLYGRNVAAIRNVPRLNIQLHDKPDVEKFILYQGALNKGRGLEALLEAMKELDCKLVLAGEGDLSNELRQMAEDFGVKNKVEFKGYILPQNLPELTRRAWIGYNSMENVGLSYYYSLSNKFFDYIHAGLPSLLCPFPEYLTLNKQFEVGVITPAIVSDIVKNAQLLLTDVNLHNKLSENCLKAALVLNWEMEEKLLFNLYDKYFDSK